MGESDAGGNEGGGKGQEAEATRADGAERETLYGGKRVSFGYLQATRRKSF